MSSVFRKAREAEAAIVETPGGEVGGIVETLRRVADAAGQITQIALQTRLVAFNASVEPSARARRGAASAWWPMP